MRKLLLVFFLLTIALDASATSKTESGKQALPLSDVATFEEQRKAIEADLAGDKKYSEISAQDRGEVKAALERISTALTSGGANGLSEESKIKVFNDQEVVNSILTKARDDSRLICNREAPVGSHRRVNVCHTVAERRRMQEQSRDALQKANHAPVLKGQ